MAHGNPVERFTRNVTPLTPRRRRLLAAAGVAAAGAALCAGVVAHVVKPSVGSSVAQIGGSTAGLVLTVLRRRPPGDGGAVMLDK